MCIRVYLWTLPHAYLYSGMLIEAYAPLGSPGRLGASESDPVVMDDPVIKEIAARKGATPAQVHVL